MTVCTNKDTTFGMAAVILTTTCLGLQEFMVYTLGSVLFLQGPNWSVQWSYTEDHYPWRLPLGFKGQLRYLLPLCPAPGCNTVLCLLPWKGAEGTFGDFLLACPTTKSPDLSGQRVNEGVVTTTKSIPLTHWGSRDMTPG